MQGAAAIVRSFVWLAVIAFAVGFFGVLALNPPTRPIVDVASQPALTSGPASADWNLPKHI